MRLEEIWYGRLPPSNFNRGGGGENATFYDTSMTLFFKHKPLQKQEYATYATFLRIPYIYIFIPFCWFFFFLYFVML
jgi:hypothetical protein